MNPRSKWLILFLFFIALSACAKKQQDSQIALESIEKVRQLVAEENYRKLGFQSLDEVERMTLGEPIPIYFVGLETIQKFNAGDDPNALLGQPHERLYPVLVDGNVRCSLGMKQDGGEWQVTSFGKPGIARGLARVRDNHADASPLEKEDYFAVEIPSLYLIFIGHKTGDALMLTHVHEHGDLGFDVGETEPAADVFAKIAASAVAHKGALPSAL